MTLYGITSKTMRYLRNPIPDLQKRSGTPSCPVNAIYAEDDVPEDQRQFMKINADLAKSWPVITEKKDAPPDAAEWDDKPNKLQYLER